MNISPAEPASDNETSENSFHMLWKPTCDQRDIQFVKGERHLLKCVINLFNIKISASQHQCFSTFPTIMSHLYDVWHKTFQPHSGYNSKSKNLANGEQQTVHLQQHQLLVFQFQ